MPLGLRLRFEFYNLAKKKKKKEVGIQMDHEMKEILIICLEGKRSERIRGESGKIKDITFFFLESVILLSAQ